MRQQPDATLAEVRDALLAETGQRVSVGVVWRVLDEQGLRRKKSCTPLRVTRSEYAPYVGSMWKPWPGARTYTGFYFLDETGLRLDYTRRHARAPGGQRAVGAGPLQRGRALTLIGVGVRGLTAVKLLDGALNQRNSAFYVTCVLGPQLRRGLHADARFDNLPVHKLGGLPQELAQRGVQVLFLSSYSPDFTPVEQA